MAYDAATGTVILFGGGGFNGFFGDTWSWNGTTWTEKATGGPPARNDASMADDPATSTVILFGGNIGCCSLQDTWSWNGTAWTQQAPAASPGERVWSMMAFDGPSNSLVLFGGTR